MQVGDGTTTVVLLAAEFLKECKAFVEEGVHPQVGWPGRPGCSATLLGRGVFAERSCSVMEDSNHRATCLGHAGELHTLLFIAAASTVARRSPH